MSPKIIAVSVSGQKITRRSPTEGHFAEFCQSSTCVSSAQQQTLVLLPVWCPSTALPSSQHMMVGLLLRPHTSENTGL